MDYQKIIQDNEVLKETASLVYTPEFIPYYPKIAKDYALTKNEAILYGFIRFYLTNAGENAKFYFTNEQLIEILEDKKKLTITAISLMIKSLCKKKLIDVKYTIKANGGKIRYITLLNSDFKSTLSQNLSKVKDNNNKINDNNINILYKDKIEKKEIIALNEEKNQGQVINSIIAKFKVINPSYERLFGNKTQRQAVERLLKKYNREWLEKLIEALPKINSQPYAPIITTPYELEVKLGKLKVFLEQLKNKKGGLMSI